MGYTLETDDPIVDTILGWLIEIFGDKFFVREGHGIAPNHIKWSLFIRASLGYEWWTIWVFKRHLEVWQGSNTLAVINYSDPELHDKIQEVFDWQTDT